MSVPWHKANPALLLKLREDLMERFPSLHVFEEEGGVVVRGTFPLELDDGTIPERFHILAKIPEIYPKGVPIVYETAARIPRISDRHMGSDGAACLFVPEEYLFKHPEGQTIVEFLTGPVRDYFLAQLVFEKTGAWPFGQRPHGPEGRREFYKELLGLADSRLARPYLSAIAAKHLKGHSPCPCGSGKRIRQCHWGELLALRNRVPRKLAQEGLRLI